MTNRSSKLLSALLLLPVGAAWLFSLSPTGLGQDGDGDTGDPIVPAVVSALEESLVASSLDAVVDRANQLLEESEPPTPVSDLPIDLGRLAVRFAAGIGLDARPLLAVEAGVVATSTESLGLDEWSFLVLAEPLEGREQVAAAIASLGAVEGIEFVSPVMQVEDGWVVVTGDVLVRFRPGEEHRATELFAAQPELAVVTDQLAGLDRAYQLTSDARSGLAVLAQVDLLAADPGVTWAEPDMQIAAWQDYTPNDEGYQRGWLWGINNTGQFGGTANMDMNVDLAWDLTRGNAGIPVLVLDTGTDGGHPDLNETARGGFPYTSLGNCQADAHGTAVAGCISAIIDNYVGTVGVSPFCPVLSARVFNPCRTGGGSTNPREMARALRWGESLGARVSNTSLRIGARSRILEDAYDDTRDNGMVHFGSAGNRGVSAINYPASHSTVNEVAAIDRNGNLAVFPNGGGSSNRGSNALCAPGRDIYTTDRVGTTGFALGDYATVHGTSFASPYVAGVAALMLSENPSLAASDVEQILQTTTRDLGATGPDPTFGYGLVDAHAAVLEARSRVGTTSCSVGPVCHQNHGYSGPGSGFLAICGQAALTCPNQVTLKFSGAPRNQRGWLVVSDNLNPVRWNVLGTGVLLSLTPLAVFEIRTDANGIFCLQGIPNCGTDPLFFQVLYEGLPQAPFGFSNVVRMDFRVATRVDLGPGQTYARFKDAIRAAPPGGEVVVHSGTYSENIVWNKPLRIREAPGATAVLKPWVPDIPLISASGWSGPGSWEGIDLVANGVFQGPVVDVDAGNGMSLGMSNFRISDEPGVAVLGAPFFSVDGVAPSPLTPSVALWDVDVQVVHYPYDSLFSVMGSSSLAFGAPSFLYGVSGGGQITSSANEQFVCTTSANPGVAVVGTSILESGSPQGRMLVVDGGTTWVLGSTLTTSSNTRGVGLIGLGGGSLSVLGTLVDGQAGAAKALFELASGTSTQLLLSGSAVVYDSTLTTLKAVVDARKGGQLDMRFCTVTDVATNRFSNVVVGPGTAPNPMTTSGTLTGEISHCIFQLPDSDVGVVAGSLGKVGLDPGVQNIRYTPGGIPTAERLPGKVYDVDPALAADGYHLTAASASLPRVRTDPIGFDIDGDPRSYPTPPETSYGCDHTTGLPQAGLHVRPGQPIDTIQKAIIAAMPGDTIVVHGGTYDELIQWDKPVDIVEAHGEEAVLRSTSPLAGSYLIRQSGWPAGADHVWDGIDVIVDDGIYASVLQLEGATGAAAATVRFENCRLSDEGASIPATTYCKVQGPSTSVFFDNVLYEPQVGSRYFETFHVADPSYLSIENSYLTPDSQKVFHAEGGGQISLGRSEVVDRGGEVFVVDGDDSSCVVSRSRIVTAPGRLTSAVGLIGQGTATLAFEESVIDASNGCVSSPIWFLSQNQGRLRMTSSALVFHSGRTSKRIAIDASRGGEVDLLHATIRNIALPSLSAGAAAIYGPALGGAELSGGINWSVFDLPGSNQGAILNRYPASPTGTVRFEPPPVKNMVHLGSGYAPHDRLPGPKHMLDPRLDADGFHMTKESRFLPTTWSQTLIDIDGETRTLPGEPPTYGCDQIRLWP